MILRGDSAVFHWRWAPVFTPEELTCRCGCGQLAVDTEFLDELVRLRYEFARPMAISSGYRCPAHNVRESSTGPNGPHTTGGAVDVQISGEAAYDLGYLAYRFGFAGIGFRQHGPHEARFVHLDRLVGRQYPRPRVWTYAS